MAIEKLFKGFLGLILLLVAVYLIVIWRKDVLALIKGAVPFVLGLAGLIMLFLSFEK